MKLSHLSSSTEPIEPSGGNRRRCGDRMGRRKVEIKKIEDKSSRQVTFSKRRGGLMKKAKQLSVLCDVDIGVVIFSGRGKLYDFCSTDSLANILHRYHSRMETEGQESAGAHAETSNLDGKGYLTIKELLEQAERVSGQPDVDQLNLSDLVNLEEQLQDALAQTRSKKNRDLLQSIAGLTEMEKTLSEENRHLKNKVAEAGSSQNVKKGITLELLGDEGVIPGQHKEPTTALKLL